jgi:PAS domain S-box-containing protein
MMKDYAFASSINALVFAGLDGKINYVNDSSLKLWGYEDKNEVLGKPIEKFYQHNSSTQEVLKDNPGKGSWRGELTARKKDDSTFIAQVSVSEVKDYTGKAIGTMASIIDITEQKRLEKVQQAIYHISEAAVSVENLDKLYPRIHKIIKGLIPAKNFYIALYDEKKEVIHYPYFIDEEEKKPSSHKVGKGMTEYVLKTGIPILAPYKVVEGLNKQGKVDIVGPQCIDWLGVPLKTREKKVIGVLAVQTYEENLRYSYKDKEILTFVSKQVAMAIERKRAEEQLRISLSDKESLLKEIHHRVKNNLAIISELLDLQSGTIQAPQVTEFLNSTKNRVKTMALIHETLYKSEDIGKIDSKDYIDNLVNYLRLTYGNISQSIEVIVEADNVSMNIETAIPCGLIINELVTNAFRHAFRGKEEGKITIHFKHDGNESFTLIVEDNGSGLPTDIKISQTKSLGLQLVDILTRQLDGDLTIERSAGTRFIINFLEQKAK